MSAWEENVLCSQLRAITGKDEFARLIWDMALARRSRRIENLEEEIKAFRLKIRSQDHRGVVQDLRHAREEIFSRITGKVLTKCAWANTYCLIRVTSFLEGRLTI
jgi:hypothetical protein